MVGPAVTDLLAGQVAAVFATPASAGPHVRAGKLRALAVTGAARSPAMPEVPTVAESGYAGYEATNWYAYVVAAKTPKDIVERWNRELVKVLTHAEVNKQLLELTGQNVDDVLGDTTVPSDVEGATQEPYEDGDFVGTQVTFEDVALSDLSE